MGTLDLLRWQQIIDEFAMERDWKQFHTPKNLAMALTVEASELLEIFQWLTPEQSVKIMEDQEIKESIEHELADISVYLLRMCHVLGIDLEKAIEEKMKLNAQKYPVEKAKGKATKYSRL